MSNKNLVRHSKFLSLVLRHKPETVGIALDAQGWVAVDTLLAAFARHAHPLDRATLERVVADNDKKRFVLSEDGRRIRAAQGHSVTVDLALEPRVPPATLYHGTVDRFLTSIRAQGLRPGKRHHVHLSADEASAAAVGARRGKPVILTVAAGALRGTGHVFYLSANGVWLTDSVPPHFITFPDGE